MLLKSDCDDVALLYRTTHFLPLEKPQRLLHMQSQTEILPDGRLSRVDALESASSGGRKTSGLLQTARMPRSGLVPVLRSFSVHFLISPASKVGGSCSTEACKQTCISHLAKGSL